MKHVALILAAGKGTRMKSDLPKCAYPVFGQPMITYLVQAIQATKVDEIITVVGHKKEVLMDILSQSSTFAYQSEQKGTGHAVMMAKDLITEPSTVLIFPGDMPLIDTSTIEAFMHYHERENNALTVLSTCVSNPTGYGRIVKEANQIVKIVEEKDADHAIRQIREINTGVYAVNSLYLFDALSKVNNNNKNQEYYLTDIVEIINKSQRVMAYTIEEDYRLTGINDLYTLAGVEKHLQSEINKQHMLNGVHLSNPESIWIAPSVRIESNARILPNCVLSGDTSVARGAIIGPNSEIHNSEIKENVVVKHSVITDSKVSADSTVGPFAHLRMGTVIGTNNRIGNFVEFKKTTTGNKTNAAHLSYLGDADIGSHVNFGCGSITVNYDGVHKHKTTIEDNVFVGCNVNLIAPVTLGKDSFVAAGSTVNKDVPEGALAIARAKQENKEKYAEKIKNGKK